VGRSPQQPSSDHRASQSSANQLTDLVLFQYVFLGGLAVVNMCEILGDVRLTNLAPAFLTSTEGPQSTVNLEYFMSNLSSVVDLTKLNLLRNSML